MTRSTLIPLLASLTLAPSALAAPAVDGEFDVKGVPHHLTLGPDGNVWVAHDTEDGFDVAKVEPDGHVTEYDVSNLTSPNGIVTGSDGKLWASQINGVVRFSTQDPETGTPFSNNNI